jgi:hypothetical protein
MPPDMRRAPAWSDRRRPSVIDCTAKRNGTEISPDPLKVHVRCLRQRLGLPETTAIIIAGLAYGGAHG